MNDFTKGDILLYQTTEGDPGIEVTLVDDNVWLTADQMSTLFLRNKSTISRHIKSIFESGELEPDSVVAFYATTAVDNKTYNVAYYNLDVIISVGYRVKSHRGVQFRIWATRILKEYLTKGFALNDEQLKRAGGGNYFDELMTRIRDIRSSEKVNTGNLCPQHRLRSSSRSHTAFLQDCAKQNALLCTWAYSSRNHLRTG